MEILKNPNYDFLGKTKYFVALSLAVIAAGLAHDRPGPPALRRRVLGRHPDHRQFKSTPEIDRIRAAVDKVYPGAVIQTYGDPSANQVLIRLAAGSEGAPAADGELDATASKALAALAANYPENPVLESSLGDRGPDGGRRAAAEGDPAHRPRPAVPAPLHHRALRGRDLGRRRGRGGASTTSSSASAFLAFFGYEITLNVIAALLTLVGYSVNDTIVIFDRVRENLKQRRKDPLAKILNDSVNQTLTRTLISNGTTFLAVLGLYLFGGEVLAGFGFTMVVGILVGTYSTIYIAGPIVVWWSERNGSPRHALRGSPRRPFNACHLSGRGAGTPDRARRVQARGGPGC